MRWGDIERILPDTRLQWARYQRAGGDSLEGFVNWLFKRGMLTAEQVDALSDDDPIEDRQTEEIGEKPLEVVDTVGQGAMGEVVLAIEHDLERKVAMKVMSARVARERVLAARFLQEAQITAQLDHPNIVPVYALLRRPDGSLAYTMKLIRGETFEAYLATAAELEKRRTSVPATHALSMRLEHFLKVCDAIAYAHEHLVIHRDLKPANLMLGPFNEVYVMDWGIARIAGQNDDEGLDAFVRLHDEVKDSLVHATQLGEAIGTPRYMSPEQAAGRNDELGPASDQYALGLILYELVCLKPGVSGKTLWHVVGRAQDGDMDPIRHVHGRKVPKDLRAIIKRATHNDPGRRYPGVQAFADDIRRYLHDEETVARPYSLPRRMGRLLQRHLAKTLMVALMAVTAAGLGGTLALGAAVVGQYAAWTREQRMTELVQGVGNRGGEIDGELQRFVGLLESLGGSAVQILGQEPVEGPIYRNGDYAEGGVGPPDLAPASRYGQPVSFDWPVLKLAPGVEQDVVQDDLYRLMQLREEWKRIYLRSASEELVTLEGAAARERLGETGVPIIWSYVAIDEGVHTSYPGHGGYPDAYDPRERPWYKDAKGTRGPQWGNVYIDVNGLGLILPCNLALYDVDDRFRGVAGVELKVDDLVSEMMHLPDVPGVRASYLLDPQGRVVIESAEAGQAYKPGLHANWSKELEAFAIPAVVEAAKDGKSGHVADGSEVVVYHHMPLSGLTFVVRAERPGLW